MLGVVLAITCALISLYVFLWMSPIILGLLLAVAFSYVTSKQAPTWIARALATPEELRPPAIVSAVARGYPEWAAVVTKRQSRTAGTA